MTTRSIHRSCIHGAGRFMAWLMALMLCLLSVSFAGAEAAEVARATVTEEDQYGDIRIDLTQIDLEYGDSVNLSFSGGWSINEVPYYPDFFGSRGSVVLTDYFKTLCIAGIGCSLNKMAGVQPGETLVITLAQKGRYRPEYEAYQIHDARYRMEGQTDEAFLNFREVTAGLIRPGRLYRGASPFDHKFGRQELMGSFLASYGMRGILDLADTQEQLESYENLPDYTVALIAEGWVVPCPIGVDYLLPEFMQRIGEGLTGLTELEGPWLIHYNLGRDRTGFICALLESLCGATYDEIVQDYMKSYDMLHGTDMNPDSLQYRLFRARIEEQLAAIFGVETQALPGVDMPRAARDYLTRCGMTVDQIDRLESRLTGD